MPLYEVAIIEHPTKDEADAGAIETLVLAPTAVAARDEKAAAILVARDREFEVDANRMEVLVRPF